jgi:hypothetical protein
MNFTLTNSETELLYFLSPYITMIKIERGTANCNPDDGLEADILLNNNTFRGMDGIDKSLESFFQINIEVQ